MEGISVQRQKSDGYDGYGILLDPIESTSGLKKKKKKEKKRSLG